MTSVLVHEAIVGGALPPGSIESPLLAEGRLMVDGLLRDFAALPGVRVVTTRDARVAADGWPDGVETHLVDPGAPLADVLEGLAAAADATLVVAPETGGMLETLTRRLEAAGSAWLGASADAVRVAGDKDATTLALAAAGLPTPPGESVPAEAGALRAAAARVGFPLVVKPVDGVGAVGATRVASRAGLDAARARAGRQSRLRLERWIDGIPASVALLADGALAVPLALNAQHLGIARDGTLAYQGGETPLAHPRAGEALDAARRAVEAIPGLAGWAGVDLVLPDDGPPVVVEVNPRLTTPYAGLRLVSPANLAGLILEAALTGRLPRGPLPFTGAAAWTTAHARRVGGPTPTPASRSGA